MGAAVGCAGEGGGGGATSHVAQRSSPSVSGVPGDFVPATSPPAAGGVSFLVLLFLAAQFVAHGGNLDVLDSCTGCEVDLDSHGPLGEVDQEYILGQASLVHRVAPHCQAVAAWAAVSPR